MKKFLLFLLFLLFMPVLSVLPAPSIKQLYGQLENMEPNELGRLAQIFIYRTFLLDGLLAKKLLEKKDKTWLSIFNKNNADSVDFAGKRIEYPWASITTICNYMNETTRVWLSNFDKVTDKTFNAAPVFLFFSINDQYIRRRDEFFSIIKEHIKTSTSKISKILSSFLNINTINLFFLTDKGRKKVIGMNHDFIKILDDDINTPAKLGEEIKEYNKETAELFNLCANVEKNFFEAYVKADEFKEIYTFTYDRIYCHLSKKISTEKIRLPFDAVYIIEKLIGDGNDLDQAINLLDSSIKEFEEEKDVRSILFSEYLLDCALMRKKEIISQEEREKLLKIVEKEKLDKEKKKNNLVIPVLIPEINDNKEDKEQEIKELEEEIIEEIEEELKDIKIIEEASVSFEKEIKQYCEYEKIKNIMVGKNGSPAVCIGQSWGTQPYEGMTIVLFPKKEQSCYLASINKAKIQELIKNKHVNFRSEKKDKFHLFSTKVDEYLSCGIAYAKTMTILNMSEKQKKEFEREKKEFLELSQKLDCPIDLTENQIAVMIPGTWINSKKYFYEKDFSDLEKEKVPGIHHGCFVYLFNKKTGKCTHACFHETKQSAEYHRNFKGQFLN